MLAALYVAFLAAVPVLRAWEKLASIAWVWVWLGLFLAKQIWDSIRVGRFADIGGSRIARVHSALGGSIDDLVARIRSSHNRRLKEDMSRSLVSGLLRQVREYAEIALGTGDDCALRVTLAVPLPEGTSNPSKIKVWCYDATHGNRRFTELPLDPAAPMPGSPLAFISGQVQIVDDVQADPRIPQTEQRSYRSILSIPVKAGGPKGEILAVMNIDATEPNLFTTTVVERAILPLVASPMNLVGLILTMRREDCRYAFNS